MRSWRGAGRSSEVSGERSAVSGMIFSRSPLSFYDILSTAHCLPLTAHAVGETGMSDLVDRLTDLQRRVAELRDFL